jgi:3-hydroxyisobutyrate dehydrogenase
MKIGFIGTGIMGSSMAGHLMAAGHTLHVYNRTRSKAEGLVSLGAQWFDSPTALAKASEVIITIIGYPKDVEAMYLGESGILQHAPKGCITIDMTTSSPELAKQIANVGLGRGIACLDAPVSGGDIGAKEARLSIMVGGDRSAFDMLEPIWKLLGKTFVYQGAAGCGQHTKMVNQTLIASSMVGLCEALLYAKNSGLDPATVLESVSSGAAGSWSLSNLLPRILKEDYSPGFFVDHFVKDLGIVLEEAARMNIEMPGVDLAKRLYNQLQDMGHGSSGTQALWLAVQSHKNA